MICPSRQQHIGSDNHEMQLLAVPFPRSMDEENGAATCLSKEFLEDTPDFADNEGTLLHDELRAVQDKS